MIAAFLRRVDLSGAKLSGAYLHGADLSGVYPIGADLMSVMDITEEQIESAMITDTNEIPDYLTAPAKRKKQVKKKIKE